MLGKNPVIAVPIPRNTNETIAINCSFMRANKKIPVTARRLGISRRLCRSPISDPAKDADLIEKLFSNVC